MPIKISSLDSVVSKYTIFVAPDNQSRKEQIKTNSISNILNLNRTEIDSKSTVNIYTDDENDKSLQFTLELKNLSD